MNLSLLEPHLDFLKTHPTHIPIVVGATASGKSALGVLLAQLLDGEVIVADSRQCYQGMDIGSGKTLGSDMGSIPHYIQDSMGTDDIMNVGRFLDMCTQTIADIQKRSKRPVILGGTGLYIQALVEGYALQPNVDPVIRKEVENIMELSGVNGVIEEINKYIISQDQLPHDLHNPRRASRVLELLRSGHPLLQEKIKLPHHWYIIGLQWPRSVLRERIRLRHEQMFDEEGIIREYQHLLAMGYSKDHEAMTSIGYGEVADLLSGKSTQQEAMEQTVLHAQQYAKRQETWWKRMEKTTTIQWIDGEAFYTSKGE